MKTKNRTLSLPEDVWNTIFHAVADRAMQEREMAQESDLTADLERAEELLSSLMLPIPKE